MRKIFCVLLFIILMTLTVFNGYSADIDGIDNGYEWDGATPYVMIDGESNCGIDFAIMKMILDNENDASYFCFMLRDRLLEPDNLLAGVSFSVEDSEQFVFTSGGTPLEYDADKFSLEGAVSIDVNDGATCEVRLGFKEGLPEVINGTVRFIDANGMPSNEYDFSLVNEGYVEQTAVVIRPTADNKDPAYNPEITSDKTVRTTVKTTKSTTKPKDNNVSRTFIDGYTTHDIVINTSPPYTYTWSTSPNITTTAEESATINSSTTQKNVKATKPKKESEAVTIYYVEKQIIVSNQNVTEKSSHKKQSSSVSSEKETMIDITDMSESTGNTRQNVTLADEVYVTNGMKYKYIIGAVSATVLVLLAAWSAKSSKHKPDAETENRND